MYTTLIFDVDGTILDTEEAILKSLQQTLKREANLVYEKEELTFALGIPGKDALERLNVRDSERILSIWSNVMLSFMEDIKVFEQMEDVFEQLASKQIKLGIVTSKTDQEMKDEFDCYGLNHYFSEAITASHTENHKPHPEPLLTCLENLAVNKKTAIYIGDSIYDLECAKSAGVPFALALWGSKTQEGFEEADYILTEPKDVLKLI